MTKQNNDDDDGDDDKYDFEALDKLDFMNQFHFHFQFQTNSLKLEIFNCQILYSVDHKWTY